MDQSNDEDQKLVAVPKKYSNKYLFYLGQLLMKRTLKLLLSVSLFLLCYSSSSGFCLFPYSFTEFNVYFSTLLFSIFTRALERKYMFLVCNGILAFLAKTTTSKSNDNSCTYSFSCSITSINNHESHDESLDQDAIAYAAGEDEGESPTIQEEEEEEEEDDDGDGQQEELENGTLLQAEEIPQAFSVEEKGGSESLIKQREEEMDTPELETNHVNDYLAATSTDELKKKFEEFIRKMKEEIRIEAQRQPIAV
ncbi:unnamed protein product [Prunus brigantina]